MYSHYGRKIEIKTSTFHMLSFDFSWYHSSCHLCFFSHPKPSKWNHHGCYTKDSCNSCVFFMAGHTPSRKNKSPSIIHKQAQKLNKREKNEKKWNEKEKKKKHREFDLGFILILQCGFHQNNHIYSSNIGPKLIGILFHLWGQVAIKW